MKTFVNKIIILLSAFILTSCSSKIIIRQPYQKTVADLKLLFDAHNKKIMGAEKTKTLMKPKEKDESQAELAARLVRMMSMKKKPNSSFYARFSEKSANESSWYMTNSNINSMKIQANSTHVSIVIKYKGKSKSKIIIKAHRYNGVFFNDPDYRLQNDWTKKIYHFLSNRLLQK